MAFEVSYNSGIFTRVTFVFINSGNRHKITLLETLCFLMLYDGNIPSRLCLVKSV